MLEFLQGDTPINNGILLMMDTIIIMNSLTIILKWFTKYKQRNKCS